ncbi:transcription antitermination factor NusB [Tumebacillus sp. ITR2]|jgi:N utilization substance protein B|uniref:Transcription antitermination protein NusB n=1 Tax=Tumebacillus amylolyticus TaxID=2801339 RepID=A0ABS1JCX3_9BACL|nr:transcription antitermination factor NusB [Tumebacillus amylolyticus]MBL0388133.1 transcription antitermination factor NusB [Tumebacillus amylolyticus]
MSRRTSREFALQGLFQIDVVSADVQNAITHVLEQEGAEVDPLFVRDLVSGTVSRQDMIDELLKKYSVGWDLTRMANVDRNVLRMAVYEMLFHPETPSHVVINEAIDLAKGFSTPESGKFVNGILAKILPEVDALRAQVGQ